MIQIDKNAYCFYILKAFLKHFINMDYSLLTALSNFTCTQMLKSFSSLDPQILAPKFQETNSLQEPQ